MYFNTIQTLTVKQFAWFVTCSLHLRDWFLYLSQFFHSLNQIHQILWAKRINNHTVCHDINNHQGYTMENAPTNKLNTNKKKVHCWLKSKVSTRMPGIGGREWVVIIIRKTWGGSVKGEKVWWQSIKNNTTAVKKGMLCSFGKSPLEIKEIT